ncbi:hypothetical protein WL92_09475 [Burkholderia multivorans]|uniref:hypothetical protein n=1 Tax=Burkholderia multivorans TaxID=87883 RepID=UPI00075C2E8A|nr:hypothetical protein [Burkholderia multivorans]KWF64706.1 hypothetical protein WL91_23655 [Burkholderia multivorans]KWF82080.1 hypothetical protein WL92_09475 [Burkholderia multivorans]
MTPKEVVQAWHKTWVIDVELANDRYLADNVKLLLPGTKAFIGKKAASDAFMKVASTCKRETAVDDERFVVWVCEGNMVAHRFRFLIEQTDGSICDMFVFNLYIVENDKIVHFEEYFDTYERAKTRDISGGRDEYDPMDWML